MIMGCRESRMKASEAFADEKTIALVTAAQSGDVDGVHAAVRSGADPNACGKDDLTPVMFLLGSPTVNTAGMAALLSEGANANTPSTRGTAPLIIVARAKDSELLKIMLKGGGDPNLRGSAGEPLIWLAARDHSWGNVEILLQSGADINALDASSYTTVMRVASLQQFDKVMWLIERGADVRHVTGIGVSLAMIVANDQLQPGSPQYPWRQKVIDLLVEKGLMVPTQQRHN
jgi:ankyrin repeat protein